MSIFLRVTRPKTDLWLVKTVGLILAPVSAEINTPVILLGLGSGLALAIVEFIYVAKRVISPIYLGDAFAALTLIAW